MNIYIENKKEIKQFNELIQSLTYFASVRNEYGLTIKQVSDFKDAINFFVSHSFEITTLTYTEAFTTYKDPVVYHSKIKRAIFPIAYAAKREKTYIKEIIDKLIYGDTEISEIEAKSITISDFIKALKKKGRVKEKRFIWLINRVLEQSRNTDYRNTQELLKVFKVKNPYTYFSEAVYDGIGSKIFDVDKCLDIVIRRSEKRVA